MDNLINVRVFVVVKDIDVRNLYKIGLVCGMKVVDYGILDL